MNVEKNNQRNEGSNEIIQKEATDLAKQILERLYYPITNKLDGIEKEIEAEFVKIYTRGGWMMHDTYQTDAINDATDVILKNTGRPEVNENIENIKNLLEQYKDVKKELTRYLNLDIHHFLMSAIDDPASGITAKDIEEVLREKNIS